jgi:LysM repeat protein
MIRSAGSALVLLFLCLAARAADDVVSAVAGTVKKVDAATKTIVVKTADGAEHTFHVVGRTTVHGVEGTKDLFHGVKEGSEVAVHYTAKGTEETAEEVDNIGKEGLKATEGTVSRIGSGGKTIVVKTADGTEETYHFAGHAASKAGKEIAEGTEKSAKVTVYYTEKAGQKVAHFFKKPADAN